MVLSRFLYPSVGLKRAEWFEKQAKWVKSFSKGRKSQVLEARNPNLGASSTKSRVWH